MGRYSECTYFHTLYDAVEQCFPAVGHNDACTILRETILAPDDYELDFNDSTYTKYQLLSLIGHTLSKSCILNNKEETHYNILETAANVIKHMNDGYITQENYSEKQDFLEDISRKEFMLFAALACTKAAEEDDTMFFGELVLNIVRFRELKDLIENYTPNTVNEETTVQDFERAKPIYKMLKSLQSLGYNYNFSAKERTSLDIDHEQDEDLTGRFNFYNWLKRLMLLQLRKEVSLPITKGSYVNIAPPTENVSHMDRIAQLRGIYNKRRFDRNRFNMLEQAKDTSGNNDEEG